MEELISRLKSLPLRPPSRELDERVLAALDAGSVSGESRRATVSLRWSVAAGLILCALGFAAGFAWRSAFGTDPSAGPTPARVLVVLDRPVSFFDFTRPVDEPNAAWETKIELGDEQ